MPVDSRLGAETILPVDAATSVVNPFTESGKATKTGEKDLAALEFESVNTVPAQRLEDAVVPSTPAVEPALKFDLDLPSGASTRSPQMPPLPDLDLNIPPASKPVVESPKAPAAAPVGFDFSLPEGTPSKIDLGPPSGFPTTVTGPRTRPTPLEDALSRPSLLGDLSALPDSPTRLASNTDQATVPLIDFDLTGADLPVNTAANRGGTPTGSPMASQMATKLDLARGYIDLGVKDGARELLEEVMRDGTREQRQAAVDLLRQIER
jgi:pilus assembly protein FimV